MFTFRSYLFFCLFTLACEVSVGSASNGNLRVAANKGGSDRQLQMEMDPVEEPPLSVLFGGVEGIPDQTVIGPISVIPTWWTMAPLENLTISHAGTTMETFNLVVDGDMVTGSGTQTFSATIGDWWQYELQVTVYNMGDAEVYVNGNVTHLVRKVSEPVEFALDVQGADKRMDMLGDMALSASEKFHLKRANETLATAMLNITMPEMKDEMALYQHIDAFHGEVVVKHIEEAFAGGDPHFLTWTGQHYAFHGQCDLVLVDAPQALNGLGLSIHIRTVARHDYSYIESAAIKIGEDVLQVASWSESFLNGVLTSDFSGATLSGIPITYEKLNKRSTVWQIVLNDFQKVVFKTYKDLVNVKIVGGDEDTFGQAVGLMGDFETGECVARDGVTILEDPNAFGLEWQVRDTEPQLFQSIGTPQYPEQCIFPEPKTHLRVMSREAAEKACSHHSNEDTRKECVFDVMVTGDLELAQQY